MITDLEEDALFLSAEASRDGSVADTSSIHSGSTLRTTTSAGIRQDNLQWVIV